MTEGKRRAYGELSGETRKEVKETVLLRASDTYSLYQPSKCQLRVYLRQRGVEEGPPGPYEEVLRRLGKRHEKAHLSTFREVVDLSGGTVEEREQRTRQEVKKGSPVIYQALLRATETLNSVECIVLGEPDFLLSESGNYVIRDSKISRRITEKDHPEILGQLNTYGWLYEQTFGKPPLRLEVHSGPGDIIELPYDGGSTALALLQEFLLLNQLSEEPYSPVGWTKCTGCGFYAHCWPRAEKKRDVALVSGVDQGLAIALRHKGINTVDQFLSDFNEVSLEGFRRPWGKGTQRVGKKAASILLLARSMASGAESLIQTPSIPNFANYVMFDVEGLPPHLDELEKIYLWGLKVYGQCPSSYKAATGGFGIDGDRQGWEAFLREANSIFNEHGDLPFVHWHHYERVRLDMYVNRFGDIDGIAARVRQNLLDLLPITQQSVALPLPSYSLKVIEKYIGFCRTEEEYGGEWAMAKYIEATETEDEEHRAQVMGQILAYNQEDLEATWAVLKWLRSKCA